MSQDVASRESLVRVGPRLRWAFVIPMWGVGALALVRGVLAASGRTTSLVIGGLCVVVGCLYAWAGRLSIDSRALVLRRVGHQEVALADVAAIEVVAWRALGRRVCPAVVTRDGRRLVLRELAELDTTRGRAALQRVVDVLSAATGLAARTRDTPR